MTVILWSLEDSSLLGPSCVYTPFDSFTCYTDLKLYVQIVLTEVFESIKQYRASKHAACIPGPANVLHYNTIMSVMLLSFN